MYPGFIWNWKRRCASHFGSNPWSEPWEAAAEAGQAHARTRRTCRAGGRSCGPGEHGGYGFGVRRPLRFLAWKLELEEAQVTRLAGIIDKLKVERAQADVNWRRATGELADALESDALDKATLERVSEARVESERQQQSAVRLALEQIHALLDTEQRKRLAYLLRTGALSI